MALYEVIRGKAVYITKIIGKAMSLRTSNTHMLQQCIYNNDFAYDSFTYQSGIQVLKLTGAVGTTCRCLMGNAYCDFYFSD